MPGDAVDPMRAWSSNSPIPAEFGARSCSLPIASVMLQIYVDPAIARNVADLVEAARRSLPANLPSHWFIRPDDDSMISNILDNLRIPEPTAAQPEQAPPPIGFAKNIRHALTKDARTRLAYRLLHEHVSRGNPDHEHNVQRLLGLCSSELTKAIILYLAEKERGLDFDEADFPFEMIELEPKHWTLQEKFNFEMDLNQMTVRASGWGLLPPIERQLRPPPDLPETDPTTTI